MECESNYMHRKSASDSSKGRIGAWKLQQCRGMAYKCEEESAKKN